MFEEFGNFIAVGDEVSGIFEECHATLESAKFFFPCGPVFGESLHSVGAAIGGVGSSVDPCEVEVAEVFALGFSISGGRCAGVASGKAVGDFGTDDKVAISSM